MRTICQAISIGVLTLASTQTSSANETLSSPNGRLKLTTKLESGSLHYQLNQDDEPLIATSVLGLKWGKKVPKWSWSSSSGDKHESTWKPVWGKREIIKNHFHELEVVLTDEGKQTSNLTVSFRLYDEGLAFRYRIAKPIQGPNQVKITSDLTEFNFAQEGTAWSYNGEHANKGPEALSSITGKRRLPMTVQFNEGPCASITEAHLDNFAWLDIGKTKKPLGFVASLEASTVPLPFDTPWRVIMIGDSPGDLVDASILENLNPPCAIKDPSWIKPGVTFWDWRSWGYKAPDGFSYGLDMASWRRFIDYAGDQEIPYLLLDANWYGPEFDPAMNPTVSRDHLVEQNEKGKVVRKPAPADWKDPIDIPALIKYGKQRKVGVFLYINDKARINYDFEKTLATYQKWGAAGIKYGFMEARNRQTKVNKTNEIIRLCAKYELMCNFHDGPVPPNGDYRTWPNCTTREYCHAQADAKRSFTPSTFNTTVFVNMITGPIDMNNGMFDLDNGHQSRPRVFAPIPSTIVGECARTLITFSGQTIVLDSPEYFAKHPELFAFITRQRLPWKESETLQGKIGEFIVMRRVASDGTILLGATTNEQARTIQVPLDFLGKGDFTASIFQDAANTHFQTNRESYQKETRKVSASDTLTLKLAPGGGGCVQFVRD